MLEEKQGLLWVSKPPLIGDPLGGKHPKLSVWVVWVFMYNGRCGDDGGGGEEVVAPPFLERWETTLK